MAVAKVNGIYLRRKEDAPEHITDLVIFDDYFEGGLSGELYIPVFTGADKGLRVIFLAFLIDNYLFPRGDVMPKIISFLSGYNKQQLSEVEYYQDDTIHIETNL